MEVNNEIFKLNNADQVKGNPTKLEYTNHSKYIKGSPSFIKKILIQNQINNYSEKRKKTFLVINNFSLIQNKQK